MEIDTFYWDNSYNAILLLNFAIVIALFTSLRFFSGTIDHIDASDELLKKDNPAFAISLGGVAIALTIILSGAIYGAPINSMMDSIISVGLYGILGIILMSVARIIFNKVALPKINIRNEIVKGNIAAGIIDAGNVIASAIIIRAVMVWVESNTVDGILVVLGAYLVSQAILTLTTFYRIKRFSIVNKGKSLQNAFHNGNTALALRFAGTKIGTAFAIAAASNLMVYELYDFKTLLLAWIAVSFVVILVLALLSFIADKTILYKVNINSELVEQKNVAIGIIQAVTYMSLGLLLAELML